jgi:hypothetical protein
VHPLPSCGINRGIDHAPDGRTHTPLRGWRSSDRLLRFAVSFVSVWRQTMCSEPGLASRSVTRPPARATHQGADPRMHGFAANAEVFAILGQAGTSRLGTARASSLGRSKMAIDRAAAVEGADSSAPFIA